MTKRCRANDFKKLTLGQKIIWSPKATRFESSKPFNCTITALSSDNAIAEEVNALNLPNFRPMTLWIDEDTINQFLLEVM